MWNLQSCPTRWKNATFYGWVGAGGQNILWPLLHIFVRSNPNPRDLCRWLSQTDRMSVAESLRINECSISRAIQFPRAAVCVSRGAFFSFKQLLFYRTKKLRSHTLKKKNIFFCSSLLCNESKLTDEVSGRVNPILSSSWLFHGHGHGMWKQWSRLGHTAATSTVFTFSFQC